MGIEVVKVVGRVKIADPIRGVWFLSTGVGDVMVHRTTLQRDGWGGLPYGSDVTAVIATNKDGKWRARRVLAVALAE